MVDTSALVRIFLREPDFERYQKVWIRSGSALLPVPCYIEFVMLRHLGERGRAWIDLMIEDRSIALVALEPEDAPHAAHAVRTYGKGSGHPAQLNFGDCMTYSISKRRELPLLFAGNDFSRTDIVPALAEG